MVAQAGPWIREPGHGFAKVGWARFVAAEGVNEGVATGLQFQSDSLTTYAEVGLPGGFQVTASVPYVAAVQSGARDVTYRHNWTGDLFFEVDRKLHNSKPFAIGAMFRIPTYRDPFQFSQARGLDPSLVSAFANNFPALGDRNVDLTVKFMAGTSFGRGWVTGEIGPQFRFGGFGHGVYLASSAGLWIVKERLGVNTWIQANKNVAPANPRRLTRELLYGSVALFAQGFEPLPEAGFQVGVGAIPLARNSATGFDISASTFITW